MCVDGASWGRSSPHPTPKGERPNLLRLDMISPAVKARQKCWKGVRRPAVKTQKYVAHKCINTRDLIKSLEVCPMGYEF